MRGRTTRAKVMYKGKAIYFDDPQEAALAREIIAGADGDLLFNQQDTLDNISAAKGYFAIINDAFTDGGDGTLTEVTIDDVDTWFDINITPSADGIVDERPTVMVEANPTATTGTGTTADPYILLLEGLTTASFGEVRASFKFNPDEDDGELSVRLLFHTNSSGGSSTFTVEDVAGSLAQGAEIDYTLNPSLSFFINDSTDTRLAGDGGTVCLQVKSSVPGDLKFSGLAYYLFT